MTYNNETPADLKPMKARRLTIYDIKQLSVEHSPYYFSRDSLRFFGQTLKDFSVSKLSETVYFISAPMRDFSRKAKLMGRSEMYFNTETGFLTIRDPRESTKEATA